MVRLFIPFENTHTHNWFGFSSAKVFISVDEVKWNRQNNITYILHAYNEPTHRDPVVFTQKFVVWVGALVVEEALSRFCMCWTAVSTRIPVVIFAGVCVCALCQYYYCYDRHIVWVVETFSYWCVLVFHSSMVICSMVYRVLCNSASCIDVRQA